MANQNATYTVSDGELVLELLDAGDGWYAVSTPLDPHAHTQARSLPEAFDMARDALASLREARMERRVGRVFETHHGSPTHLNATLRAPRKITE